MPIRLVLADDHPIVLEGLTKVLESLPRYEVVGTATNGDDALNVIRAKAPAVAILDIRMPRKTGLEVAPVRLVAKDPIYEVLPAHLELLKSQGFGYEIVKPTTGRKSKRRHASPD